MQTFSPGSSHSRQYLKLPFLLLKAFYLGFTSLRTNWKSRTCIVVKLSKAVWIHLERFYKQLVKSSSWFILQIDVLVFSAQSCSLPWFLKLFYKANNPNLSLNRNRFGLFCGLKHQGAVDTAVFSFAPKSKVSERVDGTFYATSIKNVGAKRTLLQHGTGSGGRTHTNRFTGT